MPGNFDVLTVIDDLSQECVDSGDPCISLLLFLKNLLGETAKDRGLNRVSVEDIFSEATLRRFELSALTVKGNEPDSMFAVYMPTLSDGGCIEARVLDDFLLPAEATRRYLIRQRSLDSLISFVRRSALTVCFPCFIMAKRTTCKLSSAS